MESTEVDWPQISDIFGTTGYSIYNNLYLQNYAHVGQANTINKGTNTIQANY